MSSSSSTSQSTGSGTSFIPDYPQSAFLQMIAGEANNYANQAYGRYDNTFQPLENSLISDSNKFQSPGYLSQVAGAASSGAAQAGEAQRTNSLRDLQAFGIDPSGGRYAELDKAERGRTAATQAGAAQEAMRQTQQAGRDMRMQALNIGQQNLTRASHNLDTAASLKYPPLGQTHDTQSTSSQQSGSRPTNPNPQNSGSRSTQGNNPSGGGGGGGGGGGVYGGSPAIGGSPSNGSGGDQSGYSPVNDPNFTDYSSGNNLSYGGQSDPFAGNYGVDNTGGGYNPGADQTQSSTDPNYTDYSSGGFDSSGGSTDNSGYSSGGFDTSGGSTDNSGYSSGGAIDLQGGGQAPEDASPSQGQDTDDIQANVNADEFVIPKDVALWKGQEFFQNLINKSRKARVMAPAQGGPPNPGQGQPQPAMG